MGTVRAFLQQPVPLIQNPVELVQYMDVFRLDLADGFIYEPPLFFWPALYQRQMGRGKYYCTKMARQLCWGMEGYLI